MLICGMSVISPAATPIKQHFKNSQYLLTAAQSNTENPPLAILKSNHKLK
jgi:hypothetical protein